jgi:hypothetical protein
LIAKFFAQTPRGLAALRKYFPHIERKAVLVPEDVITKIQETSDPWLKPPANSEDLQGLQAMQTLKDLYRFA